jgi:hypothetical protein
MKVAVPNNNGGGTPRPTILPLKPTEEEDIPKHLLRNFDLRTVVNDANCPKHRVYIRVLDGTESARTTIKWRVDAEKIITGLAIASQKNQALLLQEILKGSALTCFMSGLRKVARWNERPRLLLPN